MVCSMYLPKMVFVLLSRVQPENFLVLCGAVAIEQFGYDFGFTAFMLYILYFADDLTRPLTMLSAPDSWRLE